MNLAFSDPFLSTPLPVSKICHYETSSLIISCDTAPALGTGVHLIFIWPVATASVISVST